MKSIKILPNSLHVVFSSARTAEVNNQLDFHMIASTYFVNKSHEISYNNLFVNISSLGINKFFIVYIIDLTQEEIDSQYKSDFYRNNQLWFEVHYTSRQNFIPMINSGSFNFNETNKYCLYIFLGMSWVELITMFKSEDINIIVSGGSPTKRHLLSPLEIRLSSYIVALFDMNTIEAINHNNFKFVDKERYLPIFDFSNKSKISHTKNGIITSIPITNPTPYNKVPSTNSDNTNIKIDTNNKDISIENIDTKSCCNQTQPITINKVFKRGLHSSVSTFAQHNISSNNRRSFLSNCFKDLEKLIANRQHNVELQNTIEEYLFNSENYYNSINKSVGPSINFSSTTSKWILEKHNLIVDYLDNMIKKEIKLNKGKLTLIQKNLLYTKEVLEVLGSKNTSNILISFFLDLVSKEVNEGRLIQMDCFTSLGKKLISIYCFKLYSKYCYENKTKLSFGEWKTLKFNDIQYLFESPTIVSIAGNIANFLTTSSINMIELTSDYGDDRKLHNIIKIEEQSRKIIIKNDKTRIFSVPTKLPMIVEPKPYKMIDGKIQPGGYLKNDIFYSENLFIDKVGYRDTTKLKQDNDVIDLINGVSRVPYKINKEVLEYIQLYGIEKGIILLDSHVMSKKNTISKEVDKFYDNPYIKMTKKLNKELRSLQSTIYLQNNILNIAELYSLVDKIYFPVRSDQRTRIYCITEYFNYQSTDLAKGLLLFYNHGVIYKHDTEAINYLKSYGATLFESTLGKKSLNYKIKWVDNNTDYIINFKFNDIINKSKEKACFLAFCFEYTRFVKFMSDVNATKFNTYLPIQLDASCNGYQHLSLLTRDKKVHKHLNLTPSTKDDDPNDLYNYMLIKIREYIKYKLCNYLWESEEEKESLIRLDKIILNRNILKKALMTFSYNASIVQMVNYIKEMLKTHTIQESNNVLIDDNVELSIQGVARKYKDNTVYTVGDELENYITSKDIYKFVKYFKVVLDNEFPRMKLLNTYLRSIIKICTKQNMTIPWPLPSGAIISQSYLNSKTLKMRPFAFIKSKYNFRTIIKDEFDGVKQLNATMPNLIHSLDASSIALLYKVFSAQGCGSIFTIHDCFAVTANDVKLLIDLLKGVYIKIYSEEVYLSILHDHIKNTIINTFGKDIFSCDLKFIYVGPKKEKIPYPSIENVLDLNTNIDSLKYSQYIIK